MTVEARSRGTTRYWTGFTARVARASICSVMRIEPSSVAIADPARPETISAVSTGAISRVRVSETAEPT